MEPRLDRRSGNRFSAHSDVRSPPRVRDGIHESNLRIERCGLAIWPAWLPRWVPRRLPFVVFCRSAASGRPQCASLPPGRVRKTLRRESVQPGQIEAFEQTPLFVKLPAYVEKLYVDIGDRVEPDKPVADLWIPELHDEARQKEAMVAYANAGIKQAAAAVLAARQAVATAEAGLREARGRHDPRAEANMNGGSRNTRGSWSWTASRQHRSQAGGRNAERIERRRGGGGEADAKVASAEAALAERKVGVDKAKADLAVAQAGVGNAEADLARTTSLLHYTQVRMPYAGTVIERNVDRGDFVQPANIATAKPLFVVARNDMVRIFVDVPEMSAAQVQVGARGSSTSRPSPTARSRAR